MEETPDPKKAAGACLESIPLDEDLYRLGHTKACDVQINWQFFLNFFSNHLPLDSFPFDLKTIR